MQKFIVSAAVLLAGNYLYAQHQEIPEKPGMWRGKQSLSKDTNAILYAFKSGNFNGHFRNYFMATDNESGLTDYYANASGGGLRYETAPYHGFQFAVSGFYIFNTGSSDLEKKDSITGQPNRYEIGLFDVQDPGNKKDNDRLEEFYIKYNFGKSHAIWGRQLINTPFVNLQDGRMRPTGVEGIWLEINDIKKLKLDAGWLYAISPRGTTKWFYTGASIGLYPVGLNPDGAKSGYKDNLQTHGIFMTGVKYDVLKRWKLHIWDMYTENIFNSAMVQLESEYPANETGKWKVAGQFIRQDAVNHGGNEDPSKTYFTKGGQSMTFGFKLGWETPLFEASLNYNRITAHGRYLMPREFGREPFFTFMPRERNEGLGDVHAMVAKSSYNFKKYRLKTSLALGYYQLPDVKNYRLNKYGMPSYGQMNADIRYSFAGYLEGLELQFLVVGKATPGVNYSDKIYVINKVNMILYNLVLNFHF